MAAGATGERSFQETPTWAVTVVCAVFVIISLLIEHGIHSLGKWFRKRRNKALIEALEKIKSELMLLGFISLLLTVGTTYITRICIPSKLGNTMLPCRTDATKKDQGGAGGRKLLSNDGNVMWRRVLAGSSGDDFCTKNGKVPLISQIAVHQLHIFIFVLAVFHILYNVITMALGQAKMKKWKAWESETESFEYQFTNDPARFRFTHQTSFVRRHSGLSRTPGIKWIVAFCRQFFGSLSKVDYLTMRRGFINAHFAPDSKFNFHKYIKRSLEDDFKVVVGISIPLWIFAVIFLLLNVYKWYSLTWLAFAPLIIILLVGTKLELIIMEMAQEIQDRTAFVKGAPVYEFKITSCFHENLPLLLIIVCLGVALQFLCSYNTFPLYALVTQMGSHMKQAIFEEKTAKALIKWHKAVKDKKNLRKGGVDSSSGFMSAENTPSRGTSPRLRVPLLIGMHQEEGPPTRTEESHNIEFTFVKA
ncbi:hypothetical protein ACB092_01G089000 [Castanea dentata]